MNHIDPGDSNMDPINAWRPGSVEEQRAHFRPSTWARGMSAAHEQILKGRPEREGPDYGMGESEEQGDDSLWIRLSFSADLVPPRTMWIIQNVVPSALRRFIRHNLQYRDVDQELGLQGQFAEIHHITAKLKRLVWKSRAETIRVSDVQTELENLIGHALLALELLEKGNHDGN